MPVTLPNGITIVNVTPHDLIFHDNEWGEGAITVLSDEVINAYSVNDLLETVGQIEYVTVRFVEREDGLETIERLKAQYPKALLVGSIIAAQAYREEVVAPIPWYRGHRSSNKHYRLLRPNRFTIYKKEIQNG